MINFGYISQIINSFLGQFLALFHLKDYTLIIKTNVLTMKSWYKNNSFNKKSSQKLLWSFFA